MPDPYQQHDLPMDELDRPERVSALAVSSLVCGILCCIPVVGFAGIILGATSIIKIRESEGKLGGKTLAIVGISLGLLGTLVWLAVTVAGRQFYTAYDQRLSKPAIAVMEALEAHDWAKARVIFDKRTNARVTDADLAAFTEAYHARFGGFRGTARHVDFSLLFAPPPPGVPSQGELVPIPADFVQEPGIIFLTSDSPNVLNNILFSGTSVNGTANNILIVGKGSHLWLLDPVKTGNTKPAEAPSGATAATGAPAPTAPSGPTSPSGH